MCANINERSVLGRVVGSGTGMGGSNNVASQHVLCVLFLALWFRYNSHVWSMFVLILIMLTRVVWIGMIAPISACLQRSVVCVYPIR